MQATSRLSPSLWFLAAGISVVIMGAGEILWATDPAGLCRGVTIRVQVPPPPGSPPGTSPSYTPPGEHICLPPICAGPFACMEVRVGDVDVPRDPSASPNAPRRVIPGWGTFACGCGSIVATKLCDWHVSRDGQGNFKNAQCRGDCVAPEVPPCLPAPAGFADLGGFKLKLTACRCEMELK